MKSILKKINNLLEVVVVEYNETPAITQDVFVFYFSPKDEDNYYDTINSIWEKDNEIKETLSKQTITNKFEELLRKLIFKKIDCNEKIITVFFQNLHFLTLEERTVFNEINGVRIINPIVTKEFEIFDYNSHKKYLEEKHPEFVKKIVEKNNNLFRTSNLICCKVKSRDYVRAQEIAFDKFRVIANTFNFLYSNTNLSFRMGISTTNFLRPNVTVVTSNSSTVENISAADFRISSVINEKFFEDNHFVTLFNLAFKNSKSDIESRIVNAIEWSADGLNEQNPVKAFIYFIFAIESMLKINIKGVVVPSIMSQISDTVGFILGDNYTDREKYSQKFKRLYEKRSAIVHSGKNDISRKDLDESFFIIKSVIIKFIENQELTKIKNSDDFYKWFNKRKFS